MREYLPGSRPVLLMYPGDFKLKYLGCHGLTIKLGITPQGVAKDFAFGLYELDWDTFAFNIEHCMKRVPVIEVTGLKSTVCGPGGCYYCCTFVLCLLLCSSF